MFSLFFYLKDCCNCYQRLTCLINSQTPMNKQFCCIIAFTILVLKSNSWYASEKTKIDRRV